MFHVDQMIVAYLAVLENMWVSVKHMLVSRFPHSVAMGLLDWEVMNRRIEDSLTDC